jgi:hypothetical protein
MEEEEKRRQAEYKRQQEIRQWMAEEHRKRREELEHARWQSLRREQLRRASQDAAAALQRARTRAQETSNEGELRALLEPAIRTYADKLGLHQLFRHFFDIQLPEQATNEQLKTAFKRAFLTTHEDKTTKLPQAQRMECRILFELLVEIREGMNLH